MFVEQAKRALGLGYSCFPVLVYKNPDPNKPDKREKVPKVISWDPYKKRQPTPDELQRWANDEFINTCCGVGIPTGQLRPNEPSLIVLDFDKVGGCTPEDISEVFPWFDPLEYPAWCKTGSGGLHVYVQHPTQELKNQQPLMESNGIKIDVRADGGYVVGMNTPVWQNMPTRARFRNIPKMAEYFSHIVPVKELPPVPQAVLDAFQAKNAPAYTEITNSGGTVPKGQGKRHIAIISFTMSFLNKMKGLEDISIVKAKWEEAVKQHFEDTDPKEKEYQDAWNNAVAKIRGEDGYTWEVTKPLARQAAAEALKDLNYKKDLEKWPFEVEKTIRIADLIVMHILLNTTEPPTRARIKILTKDYFSQAAFRSAFLNGASYPLEKIKPQSYENFITSLDIVEEKGLGIETVDVIREELAKRFNSMTNVEDGNEAEETLLKKGLVRFNDKLMFRLQIFKLSSVVTRGFKDNVMASALEDVGALVKSYGKAGNIWEYEPVQ